MQTRGGEGRGGNTLNCNDIYNPFPHVCIQLRVHQADSIRCNIETLARTGWRCNTPLSGVHPCMRGRREELTYLREIKQRSAAPAIPVARSWARVVAARTAVG